ncbi:MAG: Lrp/AsnC ligand binding domain-containing protein [Halolamina sp.]
MVQAFIMVKTGAGESQGVLNPVRDLGGVDEAHIVAGAWDLIVEVSADEVYEVLESVSGDIASFDGVTDTRTYISLDE